MPNLLLTQFNPRYMIAGILNASSPRRSAGAVPRGCNRLMARSYGFMDPARDNHDTPASPSARGRTRTVRNASRHITRITPNKYYSVSFRVCAGLFPGCVFRHSDAILSGQPVNCKRDWYRSCSGNPANRNFMAGTVSDDEVRCGIFAFSRKRRCGLTEPWCFRGGV